MSDDIKNINEFKVDNMVLIDENNQHFYSGLYFTDIAIYSFLKQNLNFKITDQEKENLTNRTKIILSSNMGLIFYYLAYNDLKKINQCVTTIQRNLLLIRPSYITNKTKNKTKQTGKIIKLDDFR